MPNKPRSDRKRAFLDATAGAISGCVARFAVGPLDVLKIRFQVQIEPLKPKGVAQLLPGQLAPKYTGLRQAVRTIIKEEGIQGLWRGTLAGQLLYVPYAAVQFSTLQQFNLVARKLNLWDSKAAPLLSYTSGAVAGTAATCASYPFDILRTTLAAQGEPKVYNGLLSAARGITAQHGVRGLYRGLGITLMEIIPYSALQFGLYENFNQLYNSFKKRQRAGKGQRASEHEKAGSLQHFLCGLAAGTLAKLGTHPLDVAKKRFQVTGLRRAQHYGAPVTAELAASLPGCLRQIYAREGIRGLYKGSLPSVLKAAPAAAVTFATYELAIRTLLKADAAATVAVHPESGASDDADRT